MAVSLTISITQNSQSVANNTSNVTVAVRATWTGGSYNQLQKSGWLKIDGTTYNFTSPFNTGQTTSGSVTLFTKTVNVKHGSNGKKTLACSASYTTGVSSGTITESASKTLTTIPRKSTLSVSNGTLGTAQTLTITKQDSSFKHKLICVCGDDGEVILGSSSSTVTTTSKSWTPPIKFAAQNTTGTSVVIEFALETYTSNDEYVGVNTYSKTFTIPSSVKPSCTVAVSDASGNETKYGVCVEGKSYFQVTVTATKAQNSNISSYNVTADGTKYNKQSFTTDVLKKTGTSTITATVKDARGRTSEQATASKQVIEYHEPTIQNLAVHRCDSDGSENVQGEFVQVSFDASVSPINEKNTAKYQLRWKKSSESDYPEQAQELPLYENVYEVTGATYLFAAETGSSYDILVEATDDFATTQSTTSASTAYAIMHFKEDGTGIGIGKIAEESNLFDVGMGARFNKPVYGKALGMDRLPAIPANSDFNNYMETGCYAVQSNAIAETCANIPVDIAGRLEVWSATGEGVRLEQWSYLRQRFIPYNSSNAVWERELTRGEDNTWIYYNWWKSTLTPVASEKVYSKAAMTIALSSNTTLGITGAYTKIPLNTAALSTSERLTLQDNSIRIGANISHVKVSGQALLKCGSTTGNRHARIQKVSGSTTTSHSWACVYGVASSNTPYVCTPVIIPVKEGDLLKIVYYTSDATDMIASGSSANGWQTYLTVEEL